MVGRTFWRLSGIGLALLAIGLPLAALAREPASDRPRDLPDPALADAALHAVTFVDAQQGWAVGDRGVIWHTVDGGRHWQLQASGIDCPLWTVQFIDPRHGFAAGGATRPFSGASHGVWLETRDGGEHWRVDRNVLLPTVRAIKFLDRQQGWAISRSSAMFPVGVFTTNDGGRSWTALAQAESNERGRPTTIGASWLTGDFADLNVGMVAGRTGALGTIRRHGIEPARTVDFGLRSLHRARLNSPTEGWLVGDGGLVLHTPDLGLTWQTPEGALPEGAAEHFDFHALAALPAEKGSQRCWAAGSPGTRVFFTGDGGRTWQAGNTGQNLPIRDLTFVDDWHGWAVGDLGLILSTEDGGRTWQRQQSGGSRAALAGFYAHASEVPWELVAQLAGDEGYLSTIEIVTRPSRADERGDPAELVHQAAVSAGGSLAESAWQLPVREAALRLSSGGLIDDWNLTTDGRALDRLDEYLVRQLRIWRPSVVVIAGNAAQQPVDNKNRTTHEVRPIGAESSVVAQAVLAAVERAADPTRHSAQIVVAGLQPWKVEKVFSSLPDGQTGGATINTSQISTRARCPLAEVAQTARGLVASTSAIDYQPSPVNQAFRLLVDRLPQGAGTRDFFSGISILPGSEARRQALPAAGGSLDQLKRLAQARRNLQAILAQAQAGEQAGHWLAEVGQMVRSLDEASGADVLFQLGDHYCRQGRWPLAAEAFEMLADRYPQHPLSGAALIWLIQYYASGEAAWRERQTDRLIAQKIDTVQLPASQGNKTERIGTQVPSERSLARQITSSGGLIGPADQAEQRAAQAAAFATRLGDLDSSLLLEPRVGFPLAIASRRQGYPRQAERFYATTTRSREHDAWWAASHTEDWLPDRKGPPPKPVTACERAKVKPRLDGRLDDEVWAKARPVELHSARRDDAAWSAVAMTAYDDEFLYLAASCRQVASIRPAEIEKNRQHDADVSWQDRVEFCIDLDRDWTTFYRLSIDQRGCTHDECWRDASWNPRWFVAAAREDDTWTVEAAVPLAELDREFPSPATAWAFGVVRVAPGVGVQSWTTPAGAEPIGKGFGLLLFQ